jgi:hypothetical protein
MRAQSGNQRMCLPVNAFNGSPLSREKKKSLHVNTSKENNQSSPMPFWFHQINPVFRL